MNSRFNKEGLADWIVQRSEYLNETHWNKIMNAEQETVSSSPSERTTTIQRISTEARKDISRFKTELDQSTISPELHETRTRCRSYLENWDRFFYYMAIYGSSGNVDDFGMATRSYQTVDKELGEILRTLGISVIPKVNGTPVLGAGKEQAQLSIQREIIREKEVVVKIRCLYCNSLYDETFNSCPRCGASR